MNRREIIAAAMALPIAAVVPAIVTLPTTTYRYFMTAQLPHMRYVKINPFMADGTTFPPPSKNFPMKKLVWMSGKEAFGA